MKKINILIFLLILTCVKVNSQSWQWAKQAGSTSIDNIQSICTDANGDVYIVGQFGFMNPTADYMIFDNDTILNIGVNQIFIAKYSSNGDVLWVKGIGGLNPNMGGSSCNDCEYAYQLYYDVFTNTLIMSGSIYGMASFGSINLYGSNDMFLTKLDLNGNFLWANLISCNLNIYSNCITTDNSGNVYICGYGADSIFFNSIKIPSGGYIAKYNSAGNILWAKKVLSNAYFKTIIYSNNYLYVLGNTSTYTSIIDTAVYISTTYPNTFVSRFNSSGNIVASNFISSNGYVEGGDMSVDALGNIYITGGFHINAIFDTDTLFNNNLFDIFIAKYDSGNNLKWLKQSNSSNAVGGRELVTNSDDVIYIGGGIIGNATFGSFNISSIGNNDMFIARYNGNGDCLGVQVLDQYNGHLSTDISGNYFLSGEFSQVIFIGGILLHPIFATDIFLAKHDIITGIHNVQKIENNQLLIYANPTSGKCNITIPDDFLNEIILTLNIYDNSGRILQSKKLHMDGDKIILDLENEAKGFYNLTLSNGKKVYIGKIIFN